MIYFLQDTHGFMFINIYSSARLPGLLTLVICLGQPRSSIDKLLYNSIYNTFLQQSSNALGLAYSMHSLPSQKAVAE